MHSLFREFSARRVRHLVISGQASVLYGAALFSQDLDLWIEPDPANIRRLLRALSGLRARVHKLTPPLAPRFVKRGHGFHFVVPQPGAGPLYLDIMGRPPRTPSFPAAWRRAEHMDTPWGSLPVVAIEDLVELKKTNRPADYEVITRLALIRVGRETRPGLRLLRWGLRNIFRVEDLWEYVSRFGAALRARIPAADTAALRLHTLWIRGRTPTADDLSRAAGLLAERARRLQDLGRSYWIPRIAELRKLRDHGGLLKEGTPVRDLIDAE